MVFVGEVSLLVTSRLRGINTCRFCEDPLFWSTTGLDPRARANVGPVGKAPGARRAPERAETEEGLGKVNMYVNFEHEC